MPPLAMPLTTCCTNSCICGLVAQIRTTDRFLALQVRALPAHRNASDLEHVCLGRHLQREPRVLLDQQDGYVIGLVDGADDLEDRSHDQGRQSERGFVE